MAKCNNSGSSGSSYERLRAIPEQKSKKEMSQANMSLRPNHKSYATPAAVHIRASGSRGKSWAVGLHIAIREYAIKNHLKIVKIYGGGNKGEPRACSRGAFKEMLDDIIVGRAQYRVLLVSGSSKWGLFQHGGEFLHLRYHCRSLGIRLRFYKVCMYCKIAFFPECKNWKRQTRCYNQECKIKRRRDTQKAWWAKNRRYYRDYYTDYVKKWRNANPGYQKAWRRKRRERLQQHQ